MPCYRYVQRGSNLQASSLSLPSGHTCNKIKVTFTAERDVIASTCLYSEVRLFFFYNCKSASTLMHSINIVVTACEKSPDLILTDWGCYQCRGWFKRGFSASKKKAGGMTEVSLTRFHNGFDLSIKTN